MPEVGRLLMFAGIALFVAGLALTVAARMSGLGRLPGDLQFQVGNTTIYAPFGTMIVLSILLTVVANLLLRWLR